MIGFYGFNPSSYGLNSRLFNPALLQNAQNAFTQGYGQFRPYDRTQATQQPRQQQQPQQQDNAFLRNMAVNTVQNVGGGYNASREGDNRFYIGPPAGSRGSTATSHLYVDGQGNLLDNKNVSDLNQYQFDAYNRLLASLRGATNGR